MKKSLLILLVASMFFVFAACNNAADPNANTDDDVQKADDPEAPIIEEVLGDPAELEEQLGIIINMPEEYPVSPLCCH